MVDEPTQAAPRHGLAAALNTARGISLEEALKRADANVEKLVPFALADVEEQLARISAYLDLVKGAPPAAVVDELYRLANAIVGVAGTFGRSAMGNAAYSLCQLLEAYGMAHAWRMDPVAVHFRALRLLSNPEALSQAQQTDIIAQLRKVTSREIAHLPPAAADA